MWNSLSRGSPASGYSWKLDTGASMFCITTGVRLRSHTNKLFSFISISQGIRTRFHLFCRVYTTTPYCTHVINPYFPGLSSMQSGDGIIVKLSVKHARMIWVNLMIRRQQLNKSTEHNISITCIILSVYCIYIYIYQAYSQLMRYQSYEQTIFVCIFIRTKWWCHFLS